MKKLLQQVAKFTAYTAAGIVILLAIAVGLFRLFLPRLPEYQEDIKSWASTAIGMRVEFSGMDARWGLSGPEVEFYDAELLAADSLNRIVNAEVVSVGIAFMSLLIDRQVVVDRVAVRDTEIEVRQLEDGQWRIQGGTLDDLLPKRRSGAGVGNVEIYAQDIVLHLLQPGDQRPRVFTITNVNVSRDDMRLAIDADVVLPEELGSRLAVVATRSGGASDTPGRWDLSAEVDELALGGVSELKLPLPVNFSGGRGQVNAALAVVNGQLQNATADLALADVQVGDDPAFSLRGSFEYQRDIDGWLIASSGFSLQTENGNWPEATMRVETGRNAAGGLAMLDLRASYLRLEDLVMIVPWLSAEQNELFRSYDPRGSIDSLELTLAGMDSETMEYGVTADLSRVGVDTVDNRPGFREFTGNVRADRSGGRLEIDAPGLAVTFPGFLGQTAILDDATGTIIWRRGSNRTTLLSDSIVLRNADFALETSIEVTLAEDSSAPIIDLDASWSISDLARAKRYIPAMPSIPNTSAWIQQGIIAGRIPEGTARLYGPMDKFPFDAGEGRLFINANVRDGRIKYLQRWPEVEIIDLDVAVENTRLYTTQNQLISAGNAVSDAELELTDFRLPVLNLRMDSTGPLEGVRGLLAASPLGMSVFGGRLEDLTVGGDGSFYLDLTVPIRESENLEFTARLETRAATVRLDGFPAPLTDLGGIVTVQKDDIASEGLGGTFLGKQVALELTPAPETMPDYRIIANATGTATANSLVAELGVPLGDRLSGETPYAARLLFPRGDHEQKSPFAIDISADLAGLGIDLPRPLEKAPAATLPVQARLEFPSGEERIRSLGRADGLGAWTIDFLREAGAWDLERGVVDFGSGDPSGTPEVEETRGLHLRGATEFVHFEDWLDLSQEGTGQTGIAERIRSIDVAIGNLHIIGQHLVEHRIRVDRSARDWQVQVAGEDVEGSVIVPYDFQSGRELVLDMRRLVLPGDDVLTGDDRNDVDPRALPPIVVKADEFAIGDRFLGALDASFRHTADGLEAQSITAKDPSFDITGAGGWVVDEADARGSRSYVNARLQSKNVGATMARLDYDLGIVADDLSMLLDLTWSGGPRADFLDSLDGEVTVGIGSGQLDEVDPGAGRMFGLLSIVALPRRLSLDFRDVFGKGFGFDKIGGTFRVEDGETYTCDLSLEGPAANIGIVGRAGLVGRDYDQMAVVSANFGNTLPVVGGVLGGPQVAAVMLIFSQLFKKPLQEATEVYYSISGSWDDPQIERADAETFAGGADRASCIRPGQ